MMGYDTAGHSNSLGRRPGERWGQKFERTGCVERSEETEET